MNKSSNESSNVNVVSKETTVIWCSAFGITGFLIVALNLGTLATFAINRHLRRHGVYCLLNLAVADMLLGVIMIPYYIIDISGAFLAKQLVSPRAYTALRALYITTVLASLFSLVLVSLLRVYATFFPFCYRAKGVKILSMMFTVPWLIAIATSMVFFLWQAVQDEIVLFLQVIFALSLGIITISYIAIFIKVKTRYQSHQLQVTSETRDKNLAVTVFLVTALSLLTWIPSIVFHSIYLTQTSGFSFNLQLSIYLIHSTNSLINPIVYMLRMKEFRKALLKLVTKCSSDGMTVSPVSPVSYRLKSDDYSSKDAVQLNGFTWTL